MPQDESLIVQKFYTQLKKAPGTHKLGVLYLIDSVVRKWVDLAKQQHQEINSAAQDGTYGAGVFRVTEILPALMDNILQTAPADQKVCCNPDFATRGSVAVPSVGLPAAPARSLCFLPCAGPWQTQTLVAPVLASASCYMMRTYLPLPPIVG